MTTILFQEYVQQLDKKIDGKKVLSFVNNCLAHPKTIKGLKNIELFFLPRNTTSKIQPCDAHKAIVTLHNFLLQYENTTPELRYILQRPPN